MEEELDRELLESSLKSDLIKLATYYGVEISSRMNKGEIIDLILDAQKPVKTEEELLPPRSVRIQRIYEGAE